MTASTVIQHSITNAIPELISTFIASVPRDHFADRQIVRTVACGWAHTLAIVVPPGGTLGQSGDEVGGKLYAWGDNRYGQLGVAPTRETSAIMTPVHVCLRAVLEPNRFVSEKVIQIAAGMRHTVAIVTALSSVDLGTVFLICMVFG